MLNAKTEAGIAQKPKPSPMKIAYVTDWCMGTGERRVALAPLQRKQQDARKEPVNPFIGEKTIAETIQSNPHVNARKEPDRTGFEHYF